MRRTNLYEGGKEPHRRRLLLNIYVAKRGSSKCIVSTGKSLWEKALRRVVHADYNQNSAASGKLEHL
jgi:hypothetical protein